MIHLCHAVVSFWSGEYFYEGTDWIMGGEGKELFYRALTTYGVSILGGAIVMIYSAELAGLVVRAYTHVAHEGKFDMTQFPAIQAWLNRVAAQERYIGLEQAVGAASS